MHSYVESVKVPNKDPVRLKASRGQLAHWAVQQTHILDRGQHGSKNLIGTNYLYQRSFFSQEEEGQERRPKAMSELQSQHLLCQQHLAG